MESNKSNNSGAFSRFKARAAAVGMSLAPLTAFAAPPDVSAATNALSDAGVAIAAIGVAMVAAAAAGIVYRWVTAFLVK